MKKLMAVCLCAAFVAACGNNNGNNGTNNGTAGTNNGTQGTNNVTTGPNNTTTGPNNTTTGTNNGTTGTNNGTTGTNNSTAGTNNATTGTNNQTTGTNNNTTGTNNNTTGAHLESYGCTFETAVDMTGMATVDLSGIDPWTISHNVCIIVTTGTVVSWTGNFSNHPLEGGADGTEDTTNPIDVAGNGLNGNDTVAVTFTAAGDFGYYCAFHPGQMNGVVYVID